MNETEYKYWLPDSNGQRCERTTRANSIVIIGANGSGKSKLGAWMERQGGVDVHRISAQRSLTFSEHVPLKSFAEAEGELLYGSSDKQFWNSEKGVRWDWGRGYTTKLIQDFDAALSALLAQNNNEVQRHFVACREAEGRDERPPHTPITSLDKLYKVWNEVFPQRQIDMRDASFISTLNGNDNIVEYPATEMSDGERSVLYLAAQVLCIPENKTIIIDEPEIHLHPSIMGRLWRALERVRLDCLFIFITHDVQFASLHNNSDKLWIKSFDGTDWDWEDIPHSDLPEQLLLELLGNRKNVLFVEGDAGSFDTQLYSVLYPDYYVVPCGGCTQVISNTKAFSSIIELHNVKAYGLIDRDYRNDEELDALERHGVYCLKVAEIENLFLVEPLLRIMANRFACSDVDETVHKIMNYIIHERFENQLGKLVCQATVYSLKAQLSGITLDTGDVKSVTESFQRALSTFSSERELEIQRIRFKSALDSKNYDSVLRLLNEKGVARSIGHFLGIDDKQYCSKVMTLLMESDSEEPLEALRQYVPILP